MYAIVATGGKQYKVAEGDTIEVEKIDAELGKTVELDVVFLADGSVLTVDADKLVKAKVFAEVIGQFKGEKVLVFKFKKRKNYKRTRGHRQELTRLLIQGISPTGAPLKKKDEKAAGKKASPTKTAKLSDEKADAAVKTETEKAATKKPAVKKVAEGTDAPAKTAKAEKPTKPVAEKPAKPTAAKKTTKAKEDTAAE